MADEGWRPLNLRKREALHVRECFEPHWRLQAGVSTLVDDRAFGIYCCALSVVRIVEHISNNIPRWPPENRFNPPTDQWIVRTVPPFTSCICRWLLRQGHTCGVVRNLLILDGSSLSFGSRNKFFLESWMPDRRECDVMQQGIIVYGLWTSDIRNPTKHSRRLRQIKRKHQSSFTYGNWISYCKSRFGSVYIFEDTTVRRAVRLVML